jgi:hypothetical protein
MNCVGGTNSGGAGSAGIVNIIQLLPALKVAIIILHPKGEQL